MSFKLLIDDPWSLNLQLSVKASSLVSTKKEEGEKGGSWSSDATLCLWMAEVAGTKAEWEEDDDCDLREQLEEKDRDEGRMDEDNGKLVNKKKNYLNM